MMKFGDLLGGKLRIFDDLTHYLDFIRTQLYKIIKRGDIKSLQRINQIDQRY